MTDREESTKGYTPDSHTQVSARYEPKCADEMEAALQSAYEAGRKDELERCAKIADLEAAAISLRNPSWARTAAIRAAQRIAAAIRETKP